MKIIFLCGSVEPGRDGVGDYSRRLAGELIRQGHQAGIISLNDKAVNYELKGLQEFGEVSIPVLRLPFTWQMDKRIELANQWITQFDPEWISLQFVPFSFHPKGLAFGLGNSLVKLGTTRRWHIMAHELWVGMDIEASLKIFLWGWVQRLMIKSLFLKLAPSVIHTQTILYTRQLKKIGFKPQYLPLFGNIPVGTDSAFTNSKNVNEFGKNKTISFVVFGGIYLGAPISMLAEELKSYSDSTGDRIILRMIGRCGADQERWEAEWKSTGLEVESLGEQPPEIISKVLATSSFGISATPSSLIEKSGSVAAMREHGLTILCISRDWNPRGIDKLELPDGIVLYKKGIIQEFISNGSISYKSYSIGDIANKFVTDLSKA